MDIKDIEITDEYRKVFDFIDDPKSVLLFVTGQAGTGKSTLIDLIRSKTPGVPVIAPTGVAALNVGGQTIHSFFRIPPGIINEEEIIPDKKKWEMFKRLRLLIIDEISMVRADMMDIIDLSLKKNRLVNLPFGGVKIIVVGDLFQLPPIVSTQQEIAYLSDKYNNEFFFASDIVGTTKLEVVELTKVYRQKDAEFIRLLNNVREGINLDDTVNKLNMHYSAESDDNYITLTPDNATADNINETRLNELEEFTEQIFESVTEGKFDAKRMPAPEKLRLRLGARVMFLKNDLVDSRWVNGSVGTVVDLGTGIVRVELDDTGETVLVNRETWEHKQYAYNPLEKRMTSAVVASFNQMPLNLAYAATIHKSQGKTFSKVNIDITRNIFADGQLYVALSRCRSIEGIHINRPISVSDIRVNPIITKFYKHIVRA